VQTLSAAITAAAGKSASRSLMDSLSIAVIFLLDPKLRLDGEKWDLYFIKQDANERLGWKDEW
jgi:hypothetical protein